MQPPWKRKEAAERRCRQVAVGRALRAPNVVLPDPKVVKALGQYDEAVRDLELASAIVPEHDLPPSCEVHQWRSPGPGPPAPRGLCPFCRTELDQRAAGQPVYLDFGVPQKQPTAYMEKVWEEHCAKRIAAGELIPGSQRELAAVDQADRARERELNPGRRRRRGDVKFRSSRGNADGSFTVYS